MGDIETQESLDCDKMRQAPARGNPRLIADAKEYPAKCVWCGSLCKAATLSLLTDLVDKQPDREICRAVQKRLDKFTDPEDLLSLVRVNQCLGLQEDVLKKTGSVLKVKGNAEQLRQFAERLQQLAAQVPAGTLQKVVEELQKAVGERLRALGPSTVAPLPPPELPVVNAAPPPTFGRVGDAIAMAKRVQEKLK